MEGEGAKKKEKVGNRKGKKGGGSKEWEVEAERGGKGNRSRARFGYLSRGPRVPSYATECTGFI